MVTLTLRVLIGGLLLLTALGKGLDVPGFVEVIGTYQLVPEWIARAVAVFLVGIEFVLGAWLLWGHHLTLAALASLTLHLGFTALAVRTLLAEISVPNCGCFGVFFARPLTWGTVQEDLVMVAVSGLLAWLASRRRASVIMKTVP